MGSTSPSVFTAAVVPKAPEDPLFGLMRAYRQDLSQNKVDLGIGAYRDDNAKPWILPVVKKVCWLECFWSRADKSSCGGEIYITWESSLT